METTSNVKIENKTGDVTLVTMERGKYDKRFQLQSSTEALALWLEIGRFYGFSNLKSSEA